MQQGVNPMMQSMLGVDGFCLAGHAARHAARHAANTAAGTSARWSRSLSGGHAACEFLTTTCFRCFAGNGSMMPQLLWLLLLASTLGHQAAKLLAVDGGSGKGPQACCRREHFVSLACYVREAYLPSSRPCPRQQHGRQWQLPPLLCIS